MCDVCADFLHLLVSYETRISSNETELQTLTKNEVDIAFNYIHTWPQRQCMCCYRDIKNFERFNLVIQSIICLTVCQLKNIKTILTNEHLKLPAPIVAENSENSNNKIVNDEVSSSTDEKVSNEKTTSPSPPTPSPPSVVSAESAVDDNQSPTPKTPPPSSEGGVTQQHQEKEKDVVKRCGEKIPEKWCVQDVEKLLILLSKAFLLNFPLYLAYKHGVQSRWDEISAQEVQSFNLFCDFHDTEVPAFLFRNVSLFCNSGGFGAMTHCFEQQNLPVSTAHAITSVISNLKIWLNYRCIIQLFVPIRIKVLQYMCKLSDQELRSPATRSVADFMWAAVKDPLDSQVNFDTEGLALAFKYFTSSTLTMRLAGMAQINAHINIFNDICTSETVAEVEIVGQKLADWLTENQIISHLFGPNLHVEVIKQSQILLNFLAVENQITEEHVSLIWQAAQLKHCSKPVYDILPSLVKNLAPRPAMHLYMLLCRLDPKEHTEQSIYIASALTKLIWSRDCSRHAAVSGGSSGELLSSSNISHDISGAASSSENSVSIDGDGSQSEEEHHEEESSDDHRKSPTEADGLSDSGAPPCKQARHKDCCISGGGNSSGQPTGGITGAANKNDDGSPGGKENAMPIMNRIMVKLRNSGGDDDDNGDEATSTDDEDEVDNRIEVVAVRKKIRKRKKSGRFVTKKSIQEIVESISDIESPSDSVLINDSDCSETTMGHLNSGGGSGGGPFIGAISDSQIIDLLGGGDGGGGTSGPVSADNDNGSYSSPMSNKSEKNMADFDDEDSPCEEELVQLAAQAHCLPFSLPRRARSIGGGSSGGGSGIRESSAGAVSADSNSNFIGGNKTARLLSGAGVSKSLAAVAGNEMKTNIVRDGLPGNFVVSEVTQPGNTLLWDLLQDDKIGQLGDQLALEAEKALGALLCFSTDKFIRTKFIEGCLQNLANNRTVIVSLRLLPKLFASFQHFRLTDTHQITMWAERHHRLMYNFFSNLKHYAQSNQKPIINQNGGQMYSHLTQVQVRLQFLSSVLSAAGSPDTFRLGIEQIDILWAWLANDPECADCLFAWLQCQAKGGDQHALGIEALQHLYLKKLPELRPEGISMVALGLFQQLCSLARLAAAHYDAPADSSLDIVGMGHLWKIALKANNTDVSLAAIQYINSYYMGQQLKLEKEFVAHCMNHLTQAAEEVNNPDNRENALMCIQRALMLLNTHLETFRRRYAYHLRRWELEGKRYSSHSALKCEGPGPPITIILQPGGVSDKSILHLHSSDLVAELKAEIAKWWEILQGGIKNNNAGGSSNSGVGVGGGTAPVLGLLLSEGPLRIITQGQEITSEYDERTLADVGFKDNQMVYVSLGGRGGRKRDHSDQPALQPPPPKECLPTLLLLQPQYFEQLFRLMQTLGDMTMPGKRGCMVPHTKAQLLSRRVWDTLAMLPTNSSVLNNLKGLFQIHLNSVMNTTSAAEKITADDGGSDGCDGDDDVKDDRTNDDDTNKMEIGDDEITLIPIQELLNPNNLQKFMYTLHIIESLCKTKYIGNCCGGVEKNVIKHNKSSSSSGGGGTPTTPSSSPLKVNVQKVSPLKVDRMEKSSGDDENHSPTSTVKNQQTTPTTIKESSGDSGSGKDEPKSPIKIKNQQQMTDSTIPWCDIFIKCGGLRHLYEIFMSGNLQARNEDTNDCYNEWRNDCLATLLRVMCLLGIELKHEDSMPKISDHMLSLMNVKSTLHRISLILEESSSPASPDQVRTGFWGRTQIIHYTMNLLVCFVHSSAEARALIWTDMDYSKWLQRLVLDDPEPTVRREVCTGLYRFSLGNVKTCPELMGPLISKLVDFLPIAEKMASTIVNHNNYNGSHSGCSGLMVGVACDENKEPYGPACRDYFWLVGRLVDSLPNEMVKESLEQPQTALLDIEKLCRSIAKSIIDRDYYETRHVGSQDEGLVGLLTILGNLLKYDPPFKYSTEGERLVDQIFDCLFELPSSDDRHKPKCKSHSSRASAYDLLIEICRNCPVNYLRLHKKLMEQHRPGPHSPYPWDYWPRDDGRSECGYVGLTNLGATCYMASCMQHLYMMPQAREAILSIPPQGARKHAPTLYELQRMFAYLLESERKSYNPKSFCRVYQMDHQPLNTGEQKDMAEFFIDLVSKIEEMTPDLKSLVKQLFCGVLSNNVVSLDCGHVSRNLEEFYTVRCQVTDMRNLHESLDEVTVKDTLEGDNMYTCSQCGKKVRAEKRACFKKLPQILCFNIMRYTFNMVTMLKEKVNTHFSFPMRLDMIGYVEKTLMPQQYEEERLKRIELKNRVNGETKPSVSSNEENSETIMETDTTETINECENGEVGDGMNTLAADDDDDAFMEHHEYDLIGVTVHTGTADGGHYYSFIKERGSFVLTQQVNNDRWLYFNDAEVKVFDPSQIAAECFGGETISKTYDSVAERYVDFNCEKNNSAYMLFYERREKPVTTTNANDMSGPSKLSDDQTTTIVATQQQNTQFNSSTVNTPLSSDKRPCQTQLHEKLKDILEANGKDDNDLSKVDSKTVELKQNNHDDKIHSQGKLDVDDDDNVKKSTDIATDNLTVNDKNCDIDVKGINNSTVDSPENDEKSLTMITTKSHLSSQVMTTTKRKALLSKELEDWIWQDNRNFLQDKNIFEHTYCSFMWQICNPIPQTLLAQPNITCIAAQLSLSYFIETFIHAKEKPTMVLWVELLTKQFNSSQEACEWFLTHMSTEPWWPVQVLIQCPNQMVRQMFQRLVIHVIQRLRSSQSSLYLKMETDGDGKEVIGNGSCVTRFIKSLIVLLEHGAKAHLRHLSEFFGLLYEFSRMGEEETLFLLQIHVIRHVADFYLGNKTTNDATDKGSDDNDDSSADEELSTLSVDKTRPASLDKMIALVANLVERSRGPDLRLHLSARDYSAIAGGKGFPFLYQQIKDNINPHQTRHLIQALCRWDDRLANQIISMLFGAVTKHTELCGPFFKLLTLLTESSGGPSGLPCFSQLVLQRVWDAAEYCPQSALDWLAVQAPRNKIAHTWVLQSAESWVEQFLLAHNNSRVRNAAAYLLVSLVPSHSFRTNYRTHHKFSLHATPRELSGDAQLILHKILNLLLRLLRASRAYTDIAVHGTAKLTAYFTLMSYCMVSKNEKLMLGPHLRSLWELFHPRLSEPSVPVHHNKQALLVFWQHATTDCPENAQFVAHCADITRNIAFNYILADHDDSEIVAYNRAMLPAYYGLLRLCCQQNRTLTRTLAAHQNLQWAFKNITPHPTQYSMAVDELFRLMTLFAARQPDASEAEQREISTFRRTTMSAYLSGLDARVSWGTLIAALRILVDNDDDRLFVVYNGGISMVFEALHTLHSMYHEATACHVSGDLQELLTELVPLISILRNRDTKKPRPQNMLKGLPDALRRLATLLNTFNPPEMRNLTLEVLKELVKHCYIDVTTVLVPLLLHCHFTALDSTHTVGPLGPYFPRRGSKGVCLTTVKNTPRPPRPMLQMGIPQSQIMQHGVDVEYDAALETFYKPYHDFLDVMLRMAVNFNSLNENLVNLSCVAGLEAASLHFNFFPKFWVGILSNTTTKKYVDLLLNNPTLVEYIDTILRDERTSLNDPIILKFVEMYYPKVTSTLAIPRLIDTICQVIPSKENMEDLCADLHAIRIIAESTGIPTNVSKNLIACLQGVLNRYSDFFNPDESPPKKRKMSSPSPDEKNVDHNAKQENNEQPAEQSVVEQVITKTPQKPNDESSSVIVTTTSMETTSPQPTTTKPSANNLETPMENTDGDIMESKPDDKPTGGTSSNDDKLTLKNATGNSSSDAQDEIVDIEMDVVTGTDSKNLLTADSSANLDDNPQPSTSSSSISIGTISEPVATTSPIKLPPDESLPPPLPINEKSTLQKCIEKNIEKILDCLTEENEQMNAAAAAAATANASTSPVVTPAGGSSTAAPIPSTCTL